MFGKISLAVAVAAMLALSTAPSEAQGGRHFGGGFRGGGMHFGGGGFRGARIGHFGGGPRFGARHFGGGPRFGIRHAGFGRPFVRHHVFPRRHFVRRAFVAPIVVSGVYASCWRWRWTPWGYRRIWVCGRPYHPYVYGYLGYPY